MKTEERLRRWRLALGVDANQLSADDQKISQTLSALYAGNGDASANSRRGSLSRSAPKVAQWMGDVRQYFPSSVVQVIQKDAFERLGLEQMLLEPEFLSAVEADVNLVATLVSLRGVMPDKTKDTAREVIAKVVTELMERLEQKTAEAIRGALDRSRRTSRPRPNDIDWPRTILANLRHYQPKYQSVVPEKLIGYKRQQKRQVDLDEVILCVDQSGSMANSVVYSSIFAAVMASLPVVKTKLICFDTAILDLTDELDDPVEVLFGVQLGGGTDINQAVAYSAQQIERPLQAHLILISDLYEGGSREDMFRRLADCLRNGVNVIVLLALSDEGQPFYCSQTAAQIATMGIPVFACTPDQFPDLMATALQRGDIAQWAALQDIKAISPHTEEL